MPLSIAEMRAAKKPAAPTEQAYPLCLAQDLVARVQELTERLADLEVDGRAKTGRAAAPQRDATASEDQPAGPPARMAPRPEDPRVTALNDELEQVYEEMREHTGTLLLRGKQSGEWRLWADAHPARPDNVVDEVSGFGYVDVSALMESLGDYAAAWNGEPLAEGEWEFIASQAHPGDLKELASRVVQMHEAKGYRAPKSRRPSSSTESAATD